MQIISRAGKSPFGRIFTFIAASLTILVLFKPAIKLFYPVKYTDLIEKYTREYNLDEHMVMAVISTESKFDKNAVSHKNAKGLMQLKDETALWCMDKFGIESNTEDIYSPELNIEVGCAYIRYLTDKFKSADTVLAAYNAGEGNVSRWLEEGQNKNELGEIPFRETENYVKNVNNKTKLYKFLY